MTQHRNRLPHRARAIKLSLAFVVALGLTACGSGGGVTSTRVPGAPSLTVTRTGGVSLPSVGNGGTSDQVAPTAPAGTTGGETRPGASLPALTPPTLTSPVATTPNDVSGTPTIAETSTATATSPQSTSTNPIWWIVLAAVILLVVLGGVLFGRSRRKSNWAAQADALTADTRTAVGVQLPQVLSYIDPQSRSLSWPAIDAELVALAGRWNTIAGTAPDEDRERAQEIGRLLGDLVVAVRAENDALLQGLDWALLRPRIDQDRGSISALLTPVQAGGAHRDRGPAGPPST